MSSDRVETGAATEEAAGDPAWSVINWAVIVVFTLLTLVGAALSSGLLEPVVAIPSDEAASAVTVPLYVYLYSGFGALGYIFTKLMVELDQYTEWSELEQLAAMAMRLPAAWVLAAGSYLLLGEFAAPIGDGGAHFAAGLAFLVGLYVNVALKALGGLADRVLGRPAQSDEG